jgi:translocation and assembly module TamA
LVTLGAALLYEGRGAAGFVGLQRYDLVLALAVSLLATSMAFPVRAATAAAQLQGEMDKALRGEIVRAIGDASKPPVSRVEARRRARDAADAATALLRSEGYYEAQVTPDVSDTDPATATVSVAPGPRFLLAAPAIEWVGSPPPAAAQAGANKAIGLSPGEPGRAIDILAAEARAVVALSTLGYADAAAEPRQVIVDHADRTVRPTFRIFAGEVARLGEVRLERKGHTRPGFVRGLAPWKPGAIYSPAKLARLERRLTDTGVFESVSAALAPVSETRNGLRPVVVNLLERPRRTIEVGAAYSTTAGAGFDTSAAMGGSSFGTYSTIEGSGVDAKWTHYNLLGYADTTTLTGRLYDIQQVLDFEVDLPDFGRPDQTLKTGVDVLNERTPAYDDSGGGIRAAIQRHWSKTTFLTLGVYLDYVSLSERDAVNPESTPVGEKLNLLIPTGLVAFAIDRSNDVLDPTRGWRAQIRAEPTLVTGTRSVDYVKLIGQVTGYLPVTANDATVIAGRLEIGSITGGSIPAVPADRRFYSGGGGSVRGFAYQAVGPRLSDNTPEGGLSLAEASVEVRQRINAQWGLAAFVDAGSVGLSEAPDFSHPGIGAGVGVRYNLGFGPLRFDLGTPLNPRKGDSRIQAYVSIGQAF